MSGDSALLSRLYDVLEQTEHIQSVVSGITFKDFLGNAVYSAAVIRFFEIIGEAVKYVPDNIREDYPDIPWRRLAGLRDVLIHNYPKVDLELIWDYAVNRIPELNQQIKGVIADLQ